MTLTKRPHPIAISLLALSAACVGQAYAEEPEANRREAEISRLEVILVTGGKDQIRTLSGSAQLLDEEVLEQFDFSDLNQVLATLPGVYIRQEDGYGLRPNIGLRGVTSERSQKITLMEDGVLIKPAPYSAPAAYYIPNISRMHAVEVVKGPASIKQGPNNVGGAINLATQPVPAQQEGFIDLSAGTDGYEKYQLFYGNTHGEFGYWIDLLRYGSDGFKELDTDADTGFERNDVSAKLQWSPGELFGYEQLFTLKVGYADEDSDETYLGLTEADFDAEPLRRYAASQLDRFQSEHEQLHLDHAIVFSDNFRLNTKVYWNHYERSWNKLDGFIGAPFVPSFQAGIPISDVLTRPDDFPRQLGILRGEINSNAIPAETLDVTNNDREYYSNGIQLKADYDWKHGDWAHQFEAGIRYHQDEIDRDHATQGFLMVDGVMQNDGIAWGNKVLNHAETDALAVYLHDTVSWNDWTFNAGVRYEDIDSEAQNFLTDTRSENDQSIVIPGIGAFWQFTPQLGFLVGVNKGFSPAGATAGEDTDPEESVNYEYGLRYSGDAGLNVELIGFFSDYENLLGRCRASDSGCNVGEEFNGGSVEIAGVELLGDYTLLSGGELEFPVNLSYTYTESAFQSSFTSTFPQWGAVTQGDRLPYLPEHVARLQVGVRAASWDAYLAVNYQSEMRDQASREDIDSVLHAEAYTTVDLSATWRAAPNWTLQLSLDNITDEAAIVSWRPFGARPNKPQSIRARVKYSF